MNFPASIAATAFAVRRGRELVLLPARVTPAFFAVYSAWPPMWTSQNAHQSPSLIMPSTICLIAELHAVAHAVDVVRRVGHRLLSAGDDDLRVARLDRLRGEHHGLESGAADLVDRERGDGRGDAGLERGLARRRLADAALDDVAHDDFVDRRRRGRRTRSSAARMAMAPSSGARERRRPPRNLPIGVRAAPTMTGVREDVRHVSLE